MQPLSTLFSAVRQTNRLANRHAGTLLVLGLGAVALRNWRQWQRDKAFLADKGEPEPLPPLDEWPDLPKVSVLVAAWNEAGNIERHIESFLALRYPHKELVLCAGGSDATYDISVGYADERIIVLPHPGENKQRALSHGFPVTTGDVIFLTDADCELTDDSFERTLWPVIAGGEQAATGGSRPYDQQLANPFVFSQAATQGYSALHQPEYAPGILGRNCAVRRTLLAETAALDAPAPTGTDYVLAKTLTTAGVAIRQVPHSRVATEYPTTASAYLRQQRRWLRSVVLHGRRFGAEDEVRASLLTSFTGLTMLFLPVIGLILTPWLLAVWGVLLGQALLARLRYLGLTGMLMPRPVRLADALWQGPLLALDFVAWVQPLADYVRARNRWTW